MDKATVDKLLRARGVIADHVAQEDVDMSVFAEVGLDLDEILRGVVPDAQAAYEDLLGQVSLEGISEIITAMQALGRVLDDHLHNYIPDGIIGDAYTVFYEAAQEALVAKVVPLAAEL